MRKKLAVIVYDISILGGAEKVAVNVANELSAFYDVTLLSLTSADAHPAYVFAENRARSMLP